MKANGSSGSCHDHLQQRLVLREGRSASISAEHRPAWLEARTHCNRFTHTTVERIMDGSPVSCRASQRRAMGYAPRPSSVVFNRAALQTP